ncbi:site-specific integrase [Flavonifractor sp. DFI.6.63]|uniref:tyrosine-type recombinase/integrase n=1 Tax=Flavonifractor sp. DFI.6.63 TaxID=2963704 RepID=UPI002108D580|nr:site-specific integrase [Flavonifractor sp. DFI.6.63]MCQ5028667.1 site-specific integrase [Flavonifractor sp. DFI.6.63]
MATIEKRGGSYRIIVSNGYDVNGKQIREKMTWTPEPGMTKRQIEKALNREATLFEERVRHQVTQNGSIRLVDFTKIFLDQYAKPNLKKKTAFGYEEKMKVVNQALGHIRLKDLKPGHIAAFYANLQEKGMRARCMAAPKLDFAKWMKSRRTCMAELARETGVSIWCFKQLKDGHYIAQDRAVQICEKLEIPYDEFFIRRHDDTPLKPGTIHTYHRVLSAVLFRAVKWGYIQTNPAARADLPSIAHRRAAYLDEPDARRLLELLQEEKILWRAVITFDLLSGLRRAEFLGLRWCDVDLDGQLIYIRQTWNYLPTEGCYVDTPKTADSERSLRISRTAVLLLLEYKRWQDAQRETLGDAWQDHDGRVFTNEEGKPLFPDSVSQWFTKFVKRTGLPKVTVHSLRHTYASLMIADGTPLVVVSHKLGHAQTSTTSNIYAHVIAEAEAKADEVFDRFGDLVAPEIRPKLRKKKAAGS